MLGQHTNITARAGLISTQLATLLFYTWFRNIPIEHLCVSARRFTTRTEQSNGRVFQSNKAINGSALPHSLEPRCSFFYWLTSPCHTVFLVLLSACRVWYNTILLEKFVLLWYLSLHNYFIANRRVSREVRIYGRSHAQVVSRAVVGSWFISIALIWTTGLIWTRGTKLEGRSIRHISIIVKFWHEIVAKRHREGRYLNKFQDW